MTWLLFNVLVCTVCVQSGLQFLIIRFHKKIFSQWGPMFNYILILQQFWLDQQHKIFKTLSVFMVYHRLVGWFMVFNATFNNISVILWQSVLLAEETRVPGENQWPVASHWQTLPQAYRSYKATKIIKIIYLLKLLVKIFNTYVKLHKTLHMFILCATILTGRHLKCMRNDRLWAFNMPQNTYYITVYATY